MTTRPWSRRAVLRGALLTGATACGATLLSACGGAASSTASGTSTAAPITAAVTSAAASASQAPAVTTTAAASAATSSSTAAAQPAASTSSAAPAASGATTSLEYWHIFGGTDTPTMDHMVAAFAASHPDIKVQSTNIGFGNASKKLTTAIAGGTPPNVFMNGDAPIAAADGVLGIVKAVDSFAKRDGVTVDLFLPGLRSTFVEAGKMWGLRFNTDVRVLYYNVDAFQEVGLDPNTPPTTWDELISASQKLTKKGSDGSLQRVGWWPAYGQVFFQQLHWSNGGTLADAAGTKVLFDDDHGVGVLDFASKAAEAVAPAATYAAFAKSFGSNENDPFILGKIATAFQGSWLKATYEKYGANLHYKAALLPFPQKQISISGGFTLSMPAANPSAKDEASWQLMKYLCTDKDQQLFMSKTGQLSALVSLQDDPFFKNDPIMAVIAKQMQSTDVFTWQPPLSKLSSSCADAMKGAIAKTATSKQLLDTAAQLTQAAIDEYNKQHPEWLQNFGK